MEVQPLTDGQKCHCIAIYQIALTLFANQASNNAMMDQVQYCSIVNACLLVWDGEVRGGEILSSLCRVGITNIHQWKKYSDIQCSDNNVSFTVLLQNPLT